MYGPISEGATQNHFPSQVYRCNGFYGLTPIIRQPHKHAA